MVEVDDLQIKHHFALLQLRCQDRIVRSDNFAEAWIIADVEQRRACYRLLRRLELEKLKKWISTILFEDLSAQRITVLRRLASNHRIPNYCNMHKDELLEVLVLKGVSLGKSRGIT